MMQVGAQIALGYVLVTQEDCDEDNPRLVLARKTLYRVIPVTQTGQGQKAGVKLGDLHFSMMARLFRSGLKSWLIYKTKYMAAYIHKCALL